MTAQPHPAPPTPHPAHQCPHCARERALRLGSERARALYLHELTRQAEQISALRRLAGLTGTLGELLVIAVVLWERAARRVRTTWRSMTDADTKHDAWTLPIAAGVCAALFLLVVLAGGR